MKEEFLSVLKGFILFRDIPERDLCNVLKCLNAQVKHFAKNETVREAGVEIVSAGIVVKGSVNVTKIDIDGNRMILKLIRTGESFGESLAFAQIKNSPITITAASDCYVVFISIKKINEECIVGCMNHSLIKANLIKLLSLKHLELHKKNDILSQKTIREKLIIYLEYLAVDIHNNSVSTPFTMEELADFLSVNRCAMSRELKKMKDDGLIERKKNRFLLKCPIHDRF